MRTKAIFLRGRTSDVAVQKESPECVRKVEAAVLPYGKLRRW